MIAVRIWEGLGNQMFQYAYARALKEKLNIEGLTIVQNNDLGQDVKHYHVHLIPRYKDDYWKMNFSQESLKNVDEIYNEINN